MGSVAAKGPRPLPQPQGRQVYVIGAGFSAALGYPLINDLLIRLWPRMSSDFRTELGKVIRFHFPGFEPQHDTTFPDIESLLSRMIVNEQLFDASRASPGRLTFKDLSRIRRRLLLEITHWFHEIRLEYTKALPAWLAAFLTSLQASKAVIVSFNWDLVLDAGLFPDGVTPDYGFGNDVTGPTLLKPHGSLNWFRGTHGERIKSDRKEILHDTSGDLVYRFAHYRSPKGKHAYMPLIIPPVFNKSFDRPIFRDIWRRCVSEISRAESVIFLGYSLPDADLHARFILRCGFENQLQGELLTDGSRALATGESPVMIVNPDIGAAKRTESAIGTRKSSAEWKPMLVADWVSKIQN